MAKTNHCSKKSLCPNQLNTAYYSKMPVWKTEDGRLIQIKNLPDTHLQNILEFILRNATRKILIGSIQHDGFSSFLHPLDVKFATHLTASWAILTKEARKRELPIPKSPTRKELENMVDDHLMLYGKSRST